MDRGSVDKGSLDKGSVDKATLEDGTRTSKHLTIGLSIGGGWKGDY